MTKAKTAKSAADAKKADAKAAKPKKDEEEEKSTSARKLAAKKPAKEKVPEKPAKSSDTDVIEKPAAAPEAKPTTSTSGRFLNASGLGIKTAPKKPALSVAPGVMILGRPAQAKQEPLPRPSERRLSKKEMADIKNTLLERKERLLAGMRRELAMQKERAESKAADEVDKATDAYDEDLSFEIASANDQELEDIQIALEKIEKGTYGECEVCGCGISPSRLKILPHATTCVSCRGQEELARRRDEGQQLFSMMEEGDGDAM